MEVARAKQSSYLLGPAGSGKSTALVGRLLKLIQAGEPAYTLLILIAEPEHAPRYLDALHNSGLGPYADLKITTYQQLARRLVTLFWPLIARPAGFKHSYRPPTFLSYDLAQLFMWQIVTPMLDEGAFTGLPLRPQQIVSQLLDTLNRAALNSLTLEQALERQSNTWAGDPAMLNHFRDAGTAVRNFRQACLADNLLDLSLAVEVFDRQLVRHPEFRRYFSERFRHLIVDNVEEQTPAGQNFIASLMDSTKTVAIAYDEGGGYKRFLAADPDSASQFHSRCRHVFEFYDSFKTDRPLVQLAGLVENFLTGSKHPTSEAKGAVIATVNGRYRQEMVGALADLLRTQIANGIQPDEIAIIAPYLDGTLLYNLTRELKGASIPHTILRRRSSPRDEPRVRAWLTWLALAHPSWDIHPVPYDVAEAMSLSISGLDPARAQLVTDRLYAASGPTLLPTGELPDLVAERIGPHQVKLVEELRSWLAEEGGDRHPVDVFLHRLFHNLLAQPAFRPAPDLAGAAVCQWLVQTAGRLRQAAEPMGLHSPADVGKALLNGIYQGLVTANPPDLSDPTGQEPDRTGVLISNIYGYLLASRPVKVQVWLETAASGWWDIPRQPLSNAFILTPGWPPDRPWTMEDDYKIRNQLLSRIIRGLTGRCSHGLILANSALDRRGMRQDGPLWRALYPIRE